MATGPGPDQWMDDPRNWREQDRYDREWEEAVKRGEIKIPWWSTWALVGIAILIVPVVTIGALVEKIRDTKR